MSRKINAALKTKIALEALRKQSTVADLAQSYQVHPNQIYSWKKQLQEQAARPFEISGNAPVDREREVERLHTPARGYTARTGELGLMRRLDDLFTE